MKIKRSFVLSLLWTVLLFTVFFSPKVLLKAENGADITFGTAEEITDEHVRLEIGGLLPTNISRFELNINYNNKAFSYEGGEDPGYEGFAVSFEEKEDGVCTITGESSGGLIPQGDRLLATLDLKAKAPGFSTLALLNSFFYDTYGRQVPGTILRYYSLNTQDALLIEETTSEASETAAPAESGTAESTAYETIIITLPQGEGTSYAPLPADLSENTSETTETTAPGESSLEETAAETASDETIEVPSEIENSGELEREGFLGDTEKILFAVAGALVLIILLIVAKMISSKHRD